MYPTLIGGRDKTSCTEPNRIRYSLTTPDLRPMSRDRLHLHHEDLHFLLDQDNNARSVLAETWWQN